MDKKIYTEPYYYEIGRPVLFLWEGEWVKSKITNDYRTHDGVINVETDGGKKLWCGERRHEEFVKEL